jgi:fumarate reductase subunit C
MLFVASILLGNDAMWTVTRFFEGYFVFGRSHPGIVSLIVAVVMVLFALHGVLALRKMPADYRQWRTFKEHRMLLRHGDTTLWSVQVVTGVVLMFLAFAHLNQMLMHPSEIGPYQSADRVWSGRWWPLYLVLLFAVELHGGIGLYRLAVKWGVLEGKDPVRTRTRLRIAKWLLTGFFIVLGLATLLTYMQIGYAHRYQAGEIYTPTSGISGAEER